MAITKSEQNDVAELVRQMEEDDTHGTTNISKYVNFSQRENIEKIDAYLNSKHTSGEYDSQGREKPFFNIVTAATNIWYRATDIDRKNIRIKADKLSQYLAAFVASIHLQEWMRKTSFGQFLNEWGRALARYGSSVVKFVDKNGELIPSVIPWNRLISDAVDFENNPVVEVLWLTPAQLRQNENYDQELVEKLIDAKSSRETIGGQTKDNKSEYIKIYEVHGNLPLSYLTGKSKDYTTYTQQMHIITYVAKKEKGEFDDYCLYKGKEKNPYMITHLIKEDGRAMGIGAVEHLFEAQWMVNHTAKQIKDQLDLASKLIFQTSDGGFVGRNVLSAIETGDILVHRVNEPLTAINNKADITALQTFGKQWEVLAQDITATPDAIRGDNQPSGTAWRQVEALRQESHSLFELMTENKGLAIEEMMRQYVIPHIKKKMDTKDELAATLDTASLTEFDSMYVPNEAIRRINKAIKETILSGEVAYNVNPAEMENEINKDLSQLGNQRFIKPDDLDEKTWKEVLKDLEWNVSVDVTSEETDRQAVMSTLTTVLSTIAGNPNILQDANMKLLFNKILEETGAVSPLELAQVTKAPPMPPQPISTANPVGGSTAEQPTINQLKPQTANA